MDTEKPDVEDLRRRLLEIDEELKHSGIERPWHPQPGGVLMPNASARARIWRKIEELEERLDRIEKLLQIHFGPFLED
jgi:hypothetical protein